MKRTYIPAKPRNKKLIGGMMVASGGTASLATQHSHANKDIIDRLTQLNIDVLSHLSLYQTGVEMEPLLDEYGQPVLDVNGDPVMVPVETPVLDEFGQPVLDINGDPVTEQIPIYAIRSTASFFSDKEVSAYGVGGEGGGGGGSDYERLDTWASYDSSKAGWVLSAFLGSDLNTRVTNLENSAGGGGSDVEWGTLTNGYRQLTVDGVTYALAQNTHTHLWADITDKPSTFAPSAHTHAAGDITSGTFAIARIPTGTTSSTVAIGNHLHTGVYEPTFSKNTAFNKDFGTTSGTVAQGNDSRINNGQTAYGWGNHASAGYALNSSLSGYLPLTGGTLTGNITAPTFIGALNGNATTATTLATARTLTVGNTGKTFNGSANVSWSLTEIGAASLSQSIIAGNGLTGGGTLAADRTITLGTPSTLTAATTNGVTASSHTHAITTTSVGAANTIIQTDATGGTKLNNLIVGGDWKLEQVGTELQLKYNDVVAQRFLLDGSIVGLGEITAYGASTGGEGVSLLRTGGTMTGNLTMSADIIMNSGRAIGISSLPLKLLGNALTYNASNVLTEANTATQIKMGNGWTIEQTTSALTIKKNGVVKGTFNA